MPLNEVRIRWSRCDRLTVTEYLYDELSPRLFRVELQRPEDYVNAKSFCKRTESSASDDQLDGNMF